MTILEVAKIGAREISWTFATTLVWGPAILGAGDNENVIGITNQRSTGRSKSFSYDQLNRIVIAQTSTTSGAYC